MRVYCTWQPFPVTCLRAARDSLTWTFFSVSLLLLLISIISFSTFNSRATCVISACVPVVVGDSGTLLAAAVLSRFLCCVRFSVSLSQPICFSVLIRALLSFLAFFSFCPFFFFFSSLLLPYFPASRLLFSSFLLSPLLLSLLLSLHLYYILLITVHLRHLLSNGVEGCAEWFHLICYLRDLKI